MTYELASSDHAFEAFLAGCDAGSFTGEELTRYRFYVKHPDGYWDQAMEAAIRSYAKGKR